MLAFIGMAIMGCTALYLGYQLFSGEIEGAAAKQLQEGAKPSSSIILKLSRPLFRSLVLPYAMKIKAEDWRKKNRRLIISAGLERELDVDELLAFKIFLGVVVPIVLYFYQLSAGFNWPLAVFPVAGIFLYMYPSLWISGRRKQRHEEIKLQMPFVIDLLTLATEAGLDFIGAIQKVVEKTSHGPLVEELERMLQEIQLGTTRADSLRNLGWRIDLSEISSFVAVLVTADQMGSPLGTVLRVQSDLIRQQRFNQAEKKGAAASQMLLFPLIFFIMPAVFIVIFGPIILGFLGAK